MKKKPFISIIIANFNGLDFIKSCLKSIFRSVYKNFEVIVVDNGSTDGSVEYLKHLETEKKITLITNKKNLGYTFAMNQGAKRARGKLLFFLNNDTIISKNCLREIAKGFQKPIWAAQCKIRQLEKKNEIQTIGALLVPSLAIVVGQKGRGQIDKGQYDQKQLVIPAGAAQLIKADFFRKLGRFDSDYFIGYEDIDLAYRIYLSQKEVFLLPKAIVYHHDHLIQPMSKQRAKIGAFQITKNVLLFIIRNYQFGNFIKYIFPVLLYNFLISFAPIFKRNFYPLLGFFGGLGWTIWHLPSSLAKRKIVGKMRKASDKEIFNQVGANLNFSQILRYIRKGSI